MRKADAFLAAARREIAADDRASASRVISAAYYALFHELASQAAVIFVGPADDAELEWMINIDGKSEGPDDWVRFYRALDHKAAKAACEAFIKRRNGTTVSHGALGFAALFGKLQEERHLADYHPFWSASHGQAAERLDAAEAVIAALRAAPFAERRSLLTAILFKPR